MPDPGVRFCVNALSFTCPTISSANIENRIEVFVQLVDQIRTQGQKIRRGEDIWNAVVIDKLTVMDLLYTSQGKAILDDVLRQSLRVAIDRMLEYEADIEWTPVRETIWEKHGEAIAHIVGYHGDRQGIGCLAIDEVPEYTIIEGDIATCIHFIWNEARLITYYRKLFEIEATPEDDFLALATLAFPRLLLHPQHTQFNKFHHDYSTLRKSVIEHLSAINDHFRSIHEQCKFDHNCVTNHMQALFGVTMTMESTQTRNNTKAIAQRDVVHNNVKYRCEWHSKLYPTIDRIHFCPEANNAIDGRILIGIFVDHLPT